MSWVLSSAGPFGFVVLGVGALGLVVALALGGLGLTKRRAPLVGFVLLPAAVLVLGAIGAWWSAGAVGDAVMSVTSQASVLAREGLSETLAVDWLSRWTAAGLFLATAWAASLGATFAAGEDTRWTAGAGVGAVVVGLVGAIACVVYRLMADAHLGLDTWVLPLLLVVGCAGTALGSLKRAYYDHAPRCSAMRFTSAVGMFLAVVQAANAVAIGQQIDAGRALAVAGSPEMRSAALSDAVSGAAFAGTLGWIAIGAALVAGGIAVVGELGDVVSGATIADVVASTLLLLGVGGFRLVEGMRTGGLQAVADRSALADVALAHAGDLPLLEAPPGAVSVVVADDAFGDVLELQKGHWVRTWSWNGLGWSQDAGTPLEKATLAPLPPLVVAAPTEGGEPLLDVLKAAPAHEIRLLVRTRTLEPTTPAPFVPMATTTVPVRLSQGRHLAAGDELWTWSPDGRPYLGPTLWFGPGDDAAQAERMRSAFADRGAHGLDVALAEGSSVHDVVELCVAALTNDKGDPIDGRWCALAPEKPEDLRTEARTGWTPPPADGLVLQPKVPDALPADLTRQTIDAEAAGLSACATKTSASGTAAGSLLQAAAPRVTGKLGVAFTVAKDGTISGIAVDPKTDLANNVPVAQCVVDRLKAAMFPAPSGGADAQVQMTLLFK